METEARYQCYKCKDELVFDVKVGERPQIGRRDQCPTCTAYLHCCYNCRFWDPDVHNQCTENQGEFIRDRAEGNFCLYFTFRTIVESGEDEAAKAKSRLDSMFGAPRAAMSPKSADEAKARLEALFGKKK
jgi:DNA-directed RNA polymerase subunit RPC12/RpoP